MSPSDCKTPQPMSRAATSFSRPKNATWRDSRRFGFRPGVILRTSSDLRDVIKKNPFAHRDLDPSKLLVTFLATDPAPDAREALLRIKPVPEELRIAGRELYIYFPNGIGRSKLPPLLDRILKNSGTARNWNTVTRLLAMAEKLEPSR